MADSPIQGLPVAILPLAGTELFVLAQDGVASQISASNLISELATALGGHGGIVSIEKTDTSGLTDTYTITYADGDPTTFDVTNGNGISDIEIKYGISNSYDPSSVEIWYSVVTEPTDAKPYQWTRVGITDASDTTYFYTLTKRADSPEFTIGAVTAESGATASATVENSGTAYDPVLDFSFTLPKGDKGDTGDYIDPVVSFGTSTAAATEPSTWYSSPSSLSYTAGNFIWQKTEYTLHDAQTVQSTEKKIIGYIGQNGSGSGTVQQITFNGTVCADDGTGNVPMTVDAEDVGAIADPATKENGQVLTYDSSADEWVAATPSTGNVNTVNNVGVTSGTTNIALKATDIPMSSSDNTTIANAMPQPSSSTPAALGTAAVGSGTTWARADHVHAMPTAANVGAVSTSDVQYKIYDSVEDVLGPNTSGSATLLGVQAAMGDSAIMIANASDFSSTEVPSTMGVVEIIKHSSVRTIYLFYGKTIGVGDYRKFANSDGEPTGTWVKVTDLNDFTLETVTVFSSAAISAGGYNSATASITKSGYKPLAISGVNASGTGAANCLIASYHFTDNNTKAYARVRNIGASAATITCTVDILYVKI